MPETTEDLCDVWLSSSNKKKVAAKTRRLAETRRQSGRAFLQMTASPAAVMQSQSSTRQTSIVQYMSTISPISQQQSDLSSTESSSKRSLCTPSSWTTTDIAPRPFIKCGHASANNKITENGKFLTDVEQTSSRVHRLSESDLACRESTTVNNNISKGIRTVIRSDGGSDNIEGFPFDVKGARPQSNIRSDRVNEHVGFFDVSSSSSFEDVITEDAKLITRDFDSQHRHVKEKKLDGRVQINVRESRNMLPREIVGSVRECRRFKPSELEAGTVCLEAGPFDLEAGRVDLEAGLVDLEAGLVDLEAGPIDLEAGPVDLKAGTSNLDLGSVDVNTQSLDLAVTQNDNNYCSQSDSLVVASYKRKAAEFSMELDLMRKQQRRGHAPNDPDPYDTEEEEELVNTEYTQRDYVDDTCDERN